MRIIKNNKELPTISIVTPTLNASRVLGRCLEAIKKQDYPKNKIEIIIADGGSTDNTLSIAKKYGCKVFFNKLKTAEAGKAVGVKKAKNEIIALIDSDNILPNKNFLKRIVKPFEDEAIVASEPIRFTYLKNDNSINKYCALIGMNDPICLFFGNYDKYCTLTGKWTEMPVEVEEVNGYFKLKLNERKLPTMGANGFFIRRNYLEKYCTIKDYLFDIDLIYEIIKGTDNKVYFAKVDEGIIHLYCKDFKSFLRKQRRRIKDYTYHQSKGTRAYPWSALNKMKLVKFGLYSLFVFPLIFQAVYGWTKKKDKIWVLHPVMCICTFWIYAFGTIESFFKKEELKRENYKQ